MSWSKLLVQEGQLYLSFPFSKTSLSGIASVTGSLASEIALNFANVNYT